MSEAYNDALAEQMQTNVWDALKQEATNMSGLEYATITADVAGIFDPTPISDGAGFVLSVAQLDAIGALLSLGSMVPYAGDAVAKPLKIAKYAPKTAKALELILKKGDNLAKMGKQGLQKARLTLEHVAAARRKALERVRKAMLDAKAKKPGCKDCKKLVGEAGEKRRLQMPRKGKNGSWDTPDGKQPLDGTGRFNFNEPVKLPDGRTVTGIDYEGGVPNFDDYVLGGADGKYDLWEVTGDVGKDTASLKNMLSEKGVDFSPPNSKKFVLHHFEDGSVGYVPRAIHDTVEGGVSHTGGNSMINNELF